MDQNLDSNNNISDSKVPVQASKDILFKDLDQTQISFKPYLIFCVFYLFNAIFVLPFFVVRFLFILFKTFLESLAQCKFFKAVKILIYYLIDILMALSVLSMYPLACFPLSHHDPVNFQYWAISSLMLLQSYILLQSYMQTIVKDRQTLTFQDLISDENLMSLGLGRVSATLNRTEKKKAQMMANLKQELYDTINKSLDEENIDPTLFYFTLETDQGLVTVQELQDLTKDKVREYISRAQKKLQESIPALNINFDDQPLDQQELEQQEKRNQVIKLIRTQGFRGKRHIIDNLLWPHYQYVKLMQYVSTFKLFLIIAFVLFLKCSFPVYAIIYNQSPKMNFSIQTNFVILSLFVGMSMNIISILIGLVINDDLKGKRYILNVLETLILQKKIEQEDGEEDEASNESDDLPFNNKYKLDLSCNLSLESWDNARRLTIIFDQDKQDMYETTFSFLAIYLCYTYVILSQDFLGFDLFPSLHSFFKSPIQEWNMFIDFLLITLLFLTRVNEGSMYNETFERLQDTINKIASVYEDKKSLFDFYFSSSILYNIQNETYRKITHSIFCTAAEKVLYALAQKGVKEISPTRFRSLVTEYSKQRVLQLCATMEKLVSQIEFDSEHFCHRFLGWFKSDITKVFSTILILIYIFFHSKIKKYLKEHKKKDGSDS